MFRAIFRHKPVLCGIAFTSSILTLSAEWAAAQPKFEPRNGDRIALVGDTLIEREQESGWLQTEMAADFDDRHFIVRNLGWSADTPAGASRASFDFADTRKAFEILTGNIAQVKPTVVIFGYGMASSFSGPAGLAQFKSEFNRLMDAAQTQSSNKLRFVIVSPIRHQKLPAPLPDPSAHNVELRLYTDALREIAQERGCPFVDLFDWTPALPVRELTDDGIHLTAAGYRCMAEEVARQLGWPMHLAKARKSTVEQMRQDVIQKDRLFFDRWRPQNETYLFGFRKYEQGKNAREIPEFDPLVKAMEDKIDALQVMIREGKSAPRPRRAKKAPTPPMKHQALPDFTVAPGFEVNLWAEDPLLAKPIQMNFDPQGRLWVATSSVYPQIEPGQTADDKIVVLEDTKGTGHADKSTVFADGLFIPQAVEPDATGCYVGQSTELLHFTGKLGSGKPPERRVVLSGFGTEDTHHMVHTLKWGPDGMLYFDQSIYIHSHIETPHGVVRLNSGGIFHLRPATMQLDVFLRGFCNPWGHQFDSFGQSFVTDGAGNQGLSWGIRDATYFTYAIMRRELASVSPGSYPKFCGLEVVASRQFPDDWQGDFITSDFRAHRVVRFSISDDGAGYVTKEMPDVLTSTNVTFRPIDEKFGPDGALYIADWANPIINHGEVDFRDPRRDHEHGRIWRITAKGRPLVRKQNLMRMSNRKLFPELLSSNLFEVEQSRRGLTERGKSILPDLKKWTENQTDSKALLEALWIYQSLDVHNVALLDQVLQSPDGRIRAAAVRVLSFWPQTEIGSDGPDCGKVVPGEAYARALKDPFPRVRVEALRAVALIPSVRSAEWALGTLSMPSDSFLDYALWLTVNDLARPLLNGVRAGAYPIQGHEKELAYALKSIEPDSAGGALTEILKQQPLTRDGAGPWIELIGREGSPNEVNRLYQRLKAHGFDASAEAKALAALDDAAKSRSVKPKTNLEQVVQFFQASDDAAKVAAIQLAGNWGGPGDSVAKLAQLAGDPKTPAAVRDAAFGALKKIGGKQAVEAVRPMAHAQEPREIRRGAILTLASIDTKHFGSNAVSLLSSMTNDDTALTLWREMLGSSGAGVALANALPRNGFSKVAGKAGLRAVRETGRNEPELVVALTRAAGLQGAETALTAAEIKKLGERAIAHGDAARGEQIFRSKQQSCMSCHSIGGVGGKVAPDLTSIGASSPIDYLVESVLYPNKQIKDGYQAYIIQTTDGDEVSGIPIKENDHELVVRTASGQEVTLAKKDIKSKKPGGSLMPSGLVDNLTDQQQMDLYRFLSELGKPGAYDASKGNVARLWHVAVAPAAVNDQEQLERSDFTAPAWHQATSLVSGKLLGADVESAASPEKTAVAIFAGVLFRSVKDGPVHFALTAPDGTDMWIDGKPATLGKTVLTILPAGLHRVVLELHGRIAKEKVHLQSDDGTFLTN